MDLEVCAGPLCTGFTDANSGDCKNLAGQKESQTRIHTLLVTEDLLFSFQGNANTIILKHDD
jgi:hypothetical protein